MPQVPLGLASQPQNNMMPDPRQQALPAYQPPIAMPVGGPTQGFNPITPITGSSPSPGPYNINPAPQPGQGPFGTVPGPVGLPDPYSDLSRALPILPGLNSQVGNNLINQLQGRLSPETQQAIQDASARFGVGSGMPGSGLMRSRTARDLGLSTEALQQQGMQNYNQTIPTISRTQTVDPNTQIGLAQWNAINRSAPDPTQAAAYAKQLFDEYLAAMRGPGGGRQGGGGPAGGTMAPQTTGGYTGPRGFGFNDLAPGSGGTGDGYTGDPLDYMFGTDPGTIEDLGNWWEQGQGVQPLLSDPTSGTFDPGSLDYGNYGGDYSSDPFSDQSFYDLGGF